MKYLIIGGGVASVTACMGIREHDQDGEITIIRDEPCVPYDRPPLSKGFLKNPEVTLDDVSSKIDSFYPDNRIDLRTGVTAVAIDRDAQTVTLSDSTSVAYDRLLIATGASVVRPPVPGVEKGLPLRTIADAEAIRNALPEANKIVIVGSGYIALEAAGSLLAMGKEVEIVSLDAYPWANFASAECGAFLRSYFEGKGVTMRFEAPLKAIEDDGVVAGGQKSEADLVILACGVKPNVDLAVSAGLQSDANGIACDGYFKTSDPNIYTCGDCAFLEDPALGLQWRAEHHLHAKWTGQVAGENMAGANTLYDKVAYFWSDFADHHMILRGAACAWSQTRFVGDPASGDFIELRADEQGGIRMALALSKDEPRLDAVTETLAELIRNRAPLETEIEF